MTLPLGRRRYPAVLLVLLTVILVPGLTQLPAVADSDPDDPLGLGSRELDLLDGGAPGGTLADPVAGLADVDTRGVTGPTAAQRSAAARLDAVSLRWNDFGTPSSILPADGSLGRATSGNAATAARAWLVANAATFGLTASQMRALELVDDHRMPDSPGHAVLFRQVFDGLRPSLGSMVTVGVARGEIVYVSSSLTKTTEDPPTAELSPLQGWLRAATDVGLDLPDAAIDAIDAAAPDDGTDFTRITVPGLAQEQQARLRALAFADGSVRPVIEANVVQVSAGSAQAYTVMVDAVTGDVLHRENQVENSSDAFPFTGETPDGTACGPMHQFATTDDNTRSITVVAAAANTLNDIVVKLYDGNGDLLTSGDLGTSPDQATYSPGGTIPQGTFQAQVCPFDSPTVPLLPPYNYALSATTSDEAQPGPNSANLYQPKWRYFPANPTLDSPTRTPTNSRVGCWFSQAPVCTLSTGKLRNVQAFGPWDTNPQTGLSTLTTTGNNASDREAWLSPLTPGGTAQAPVSPTGEYLDRFTDAWNNSKCDPAQLTPGGNDINFSVTSLFASHNRMHDFSYYLGFTERRYNLQVDNGPRGGLDNDPEIGNAQAGALTGGAPSYLGRDNANQIALQEGVPGITNQYLFQPIAGAFYAPCTDGGLDMGIVGHEYTHAISNRMVGGPDEGLTSEQGGAMGEAWSDQVAAEYQFEHGYGNDGNIWAVGVYATGNKSRAIRDYSIDHNPLNYSNYGFDSTGPEVHADGEIWNGVAWEVRQAFVDKFNKNFPYNDRRLQLRCGQAGTNKGPERPFLCPGNRRWIQLMFDAFGLQQGATSFLDARDAYIAADRMRFEGNNRKLLWDAFARRGMGYYARTPNADSEFVTGSWASPTTRNTRVTFRTTAPSRIYIGDYEARTTPVADTMSGTALGSAASFTPGTYNGLMVSPRHGAKRFRFTVTGERTRTVTLNTTPNLAARASGGRVIGSTPGSRNPQSLIDGTEGTNWGGVTAVNVDASRPRVSVDLAGGVHTIRTVNVSAMLSPAIASDEDSGSRFTALRSFALDACVSRCNLPTATWRRFYTSQPDAFPAVRPRPTAPNLNLRTFAVRPTRAAAIRLVVLENQCTGYQGYAGEQDNDPANATDCKTASDRGTIVHVAELQAFSSAFTSSYNGGARGLFTVQR
jgi:hypothetical protein